MSCPDCERHKLSASMWRNEAYKHAGTPLPWKPEELLQQEYKRGYADAMGWKTQNYLEHLPGKQWVGLTDEEVRQICGSVPALKEAVREAEAKLKEKNAPADRNV